MSKVSTLVYFVNKFQIESEEFYEEDLEFKFGKMERIEIGPSEQTIENIMNYARSFEVYETQETGYIEMNLN